MSHVRLSPTELEKLAQRGWRASESALEKTFAFESYGDGISFVVALGFAAEKQDHHPDLHVGWARVRVFWSTHDAGGTTQADAELATETDRLATCLGGSAAPPSTPP
jgi:4a-hydroxytetrahydrobiopterin dehydratase